MQNLIVTPVEHEALSRAALATRFWLRAGYVLMGATGAIMSVLELLLIWNCFERLPTPMLIALHVLVAAFLGLWFGARHLERHHDAHHDKLIAQVAHPLEQHRRQVARGVMAVPPTGAPN